MRFAVKKLPTQKLFLNNLAAKMLDTEFLGDTTALLRPTEVFKAASAYDMVRTKLIERI